LRGIALEWGGIFKFTGAIAESISKVICDL